MLPLGTPQPIQPMRKQWYDKLADALLGDDESDPVAATSRYALICEKCFNHNGLVKESVWENTRKYLYPPLYLFRMPFALYNSILSYPHNSFFTIEYVCPKCGHFNASALSKKAGSISSPNSPFSSASSHIIPMHSRPDKGSTLAPPSDASTRLQHERSGIKDAAILHTRRDINDVDGGEQPTSGDQSIMEIDS